LGQGQGSEQEGKHFKKEVESQRENETVSGDEEQ
jgi:hypothetical protein